MTKEFHVLLTGNPIDGLDVIGPFPDVNTAIDWAADNITDADWWTTPLIPKQDYE